MTIAHIAGMPFEELLAPIVVSGGSLAIYVRDALRRHSRLRATRPTLTELEADL